MKSFPMFIDVAGRTVVVVGGGEQAAQKTRLLLKTEAEILLLAPSLDDELAGLVAKGRARHRSSLVDADAFRAARMAFIATGCAGADAAIAAVAKECGLLVNVVDRPDLCDLITPAIVDRDPVVVAIGTEGAAPVLARWIKTRVEQILEPRLGEFAALAGRLRAAVAARVPQERRRSFWRWVFNEAPRALFATGREAEAAETIKAAIAAGGEAETKAESGGFVSLVGAGPGGADLVTLRAVQRLQEADVIFYDRLVDASVLELARRDAERVYVGKELGQEARGEGWPQSKINGLIAAAARQGKRVVRLKIGDPLVFGRAAEEAHALDAAGVPYEIVPGVTAALAAAAEAKTFPTERGRAQHLVLTTGRSAQGEEAPDWTHVAGPGATLAFYMGVAEAPRIEAELLSRGAPAAAEVGVVERAGHAGARRFVTRLDDLAALIAREGVVNPAIITVVWPKDAAFGAARTDRAKAGAA